MTNGSKRLLRKQPSAALNDTESDLPLPALLLPEQLGAWTQPQASLEALLSLQGPALREHLFSAPSELLLDNSLHAPF